MIYFSHIPNLLGWLFSIAAGKRYCLLQIQLQRNLFMTNENKNIFFYFAKRVFTNSSILRWIFLTVIHLMCKCICDLYIVMTLEPPLMHFFEPQVVSMSTESGNGSKLDFFLSGVTIHHNTVNQHSLGTTNTDYTLHALRQISLIHLWSPDKQCCFFKFQTIYLTVIYFLMTF